AVFAGSDDLLCRRPIFLSVLLHMLTPRLRRGIASSDCELRIRATQPWTPLSSSPSLTKTKPMLARNSQFEFCNPQLFNRQSHLPRGSFDSSHRALQTRGVQVRHLRPGNLFHLGARNLTDLFLLGIGCAL